jgi:hypothetical protein
MVSVSAKKVTKKISCLCTFNLHRFCSRKLKETEFCYSEKTSKMQRRHYIELVNPSSKTTVVTSVFDRVDVSVGLLLHPPHVRDLPQLILILPAVHSLKQKLKEL